MEITLYDFVNMAIEKYYDCHVWDAEKEEVVYRGSIDEIPEELLDMPFSSWEIEDGKIVLNIN